MKAHLFLSHDHEDQELALEVAETVRRISLHQLEVWFSSDASPTGGMHSGVWFEQLRARLMASRAILVLLTRVSMEKPWILFEGGFGAANTNCDVIPLCIGIGVDEVPAPFSMYQCSQLSDYSSLEQFAAKLLGRYGIVFDETMAKSILQRAVERVVSYTNKRREKRSRDISLRDLEDNLKQHIDRLYLAYAARDQSDERMAKRRSIPLHIKVKDLDCTQYIEIEENTSLNEVMDSIFFMLHPRVKPYSYMQSWILREKESGSCLIVREVQRWIPAGVLFTPEREWEAIELSQPYSPKERPASHDPDRLQ